MKVNLATGVRTEGASVWKSLLIPWAKEMQSEPGLRVTPHTVAKDKLQVLLMEYSVY